MDIQRKLGILAGAAKYDASCASSGATRRGSITDKGLGSTERSGICHSFGPDGRCISLLKVLLTNWCVYDCQYCVNRRSSDIPRARFQIEEIVRLTLDFYRRNVIEGLFLSSGVIRGPDYTMEQMIAVARSLREQHGFRGYIHLKTIPNASEELVRRAGRYADRLSVNIELPTAESLTRLAPEKEAEAIKRTMAQIRSAHDESGEATRKPRSLPDAPPKPQRAPRFAPAGQSTQMIVGADGSSDRAILDTSAALYSAYRLKRVYYSAFSPIPRAPPGLPVQAAPLLREHRLYQADWLLRFYGFGQDEIVMPDGMLSLEVDPKLAWALANPSHFPVDLNRASKQQLLRVPGLGLRSVERLLAGRRVRGIRRGDLDRLSIAVAKVLPFVVLPDHRPRDGDARRLLAGLRQARRATQLDLFAES
ncbi:MAG: putative DNA modification/repair radical SAM protein [Candidatus Competibacteraceae bacterium]|nr:putative DNA modification/repair radical SAM protein [Candidatus Competibacteraceae bacterium]